MPMKYRFIVAAILVLLGGILVGVAMLMTNGNISQLCASKYETKIYKVQEDFHSISITEDTAEIVFAPSEDGLVSVSCDERQNVKHDVSVIDGSLVISRVDQRKWYEYIGIDIGKPGITVYLPAGEYGTLSLAASTGDVELPESFTFESIDISLSTGDIFCAASATGSVKLCTSTGDIRAEGFSADKLELCVTTGKVSLSRVDCAGNMSLTVSTGKAELTELRCTDFSSTGSTGDLILRNVMARGKMDLERSTGDIELENCDAAEIRIQTDTGNVTGSLLTDKVFFVKSDTGRIDVPQSLGGGLCEITTDTGNISVQIQAMIE